MTELRLRNIKTVPKEAQLIDGRGWFQSLCVVPLHACFPPLLQAPSLPGSYQASVSCADSAQQQPALCLPSFVPLSLKATWKDKQVPADSEAASWQGWGPARSQHERMFHLQHGTRHTAFLHVGPQGGFVWENRLIVANIGHRWERLGTDKEFNWIPLALKTSSEG